MTGDPNAAAAVPLEVSPGVTLHAYDRPHTRRLAWEVFQDQVYEVGDLPPAPLIVDCGAHVGFATTWFAARHPGCRVLAFEPEPHALALLRRNTSGLPRVHVVGAAVSTTAGSARFHISADRPAHPMASLLPARMPGALIEVPTVRLADELSASTPIDLLKMDVEGAEAAVLADLAAAGVLGAVGALAVEFHHNLDGAGRLSRTLALLEDSGFRYTLRARRHGGHTSFQNVMIYAGRPDRARPHPTEGDVSRGDH